MKKLLIFFIWIVSLIFTIIYFHENPELVEKIKKYFKNDKNLLIAQQEGEIFRKPGNSFLVEVSEVLSFSEKTAFVIHDKEILNFDTDNLIIYFQNGYYSKDSNVEKINLPKSFTTEKNGGVKGIFIYKDKQFAFISSLNNGCYYASIVLIDQSKEIFNTQCLPKKKIDYNGLGSSHIHYNDKIFLSIGAPEQASSAIRKLAQDKNSFFGKIVEIDKKDLDKIIVGQTNDLDIKIFTRGHRNPQGLTKINESFFSVEHGPKGGDELNKIIKDKNYGWPLVSYGTPYHYDEKGKHYEVNHELNSFEEPLFALVPSVGISALNTCPTKLKEYYKKPCLLALSLHGNELRPGRSIIIYLLNEKMNKVHSIEKILLRDDLKLRHFVTNEKNELYEDREGNIYISADKKGIYKLSFVHFRN
jgi:hypothetical protein